MKKRKLKPWVKKLLFWIIIIYLIIGIGSSAIDSHRNPEKHKRCVIEEVC
jgi:hypothetical protein